MLLDQPSSPESSETVKEYDAIKCGASDLARLVVAHAASLNEVNDFDVDRIDPLEESPS